MSVELSASQVSLITVTRDTAAELTSGIRTALNQLPASFHVKDIEYAINTRNGESIYSALIIGTVIDGEYVDIVDPVPEPEPEPEPQGLSERVNELTTQLEQSQTNIDALETKITTLETTISTLQTTISDLESRLAALESQPSDNSSNDESNEG